jgi:hypothetical protein
MNRWQSILIYILFFVLGFASGHLLKKSEIIFDPKCWELCDSMRVHINWLERELEWQDGGWNAYSQLQDSIEQGYFDTNIPDSIVVYYELGYPDTLIFPDSAWVPASWIRIRFQ